jgi:hypothetical protein
LRSAEAVQRALESNYIVKQYLLPEQLKLFVAESDQYDFVWVMIHGK